MSRTEDLWTLLLSSKHAAAFPMEIPKTSRPREIGKVSADLHGAVLAARLRICLDVSRPYDYLAEIKGGVCCFYLKNYTTKAVCIALDSRYP